MKKNTAILLSVILMLSMMTAISANSDGNSWGIVPLYLDEIEFDGEKDEIYDQALVVEIDNRTDGIKGGATGLLYMLWGNDCFYAFYEVTDDDIVPYDAARSTWQNEGVEFTLDFKNDGSNRSKVTICIEDNLCSPSGDAPEKIGECVCIETDKGYNVELIFHLDEQNVQAPKAGVKYGINALINDMTGKDTRGIIRTVHKNNPTENEVAKFDYVELGGDEVFIEIIEETTESPTSPATGDITILAVAGLASLITAIKAGSKKR